MKTTLNLSSMNAWRYVSKSNDSIHQSVERLSSGLKINNASDDAAGLSISSKIKSQRKGSIIANRTCLDVISLIQTTDSSLDSIANMLNRARELVVQSLNTVYTDKDIETIESELNALINEISSISKSTSFNGLTLLDGSKDGNNALIFQIGVAPSESMSVPIKSCSPKDIGVVATNKNIKNLSDINLNSIENKKESLQAIDAAISNIITSRASLGAYTNRVEFAMSTLTISTENLTSAESKLTDVNMATEISNHSRLNLMIESGLSILAQSNQKTQAILQLIK